MRTVQASGFFSFDFDLGHTAKAQPRPVARSAKEFPMIKPFLIAAALSLATSTAVWALPVPQTTSLRPLNFSDLIPVVKNNKNKNKNHNHNNNHKHNNHNHNHN